MNRLCFHVLAMKSIHTSCKNLQFNQLDNRFFSSSGLTDKDNMNSDSANKAHSKVNTLSSSLLGTRICVGSKKKKKSSTCQLDPLNKLCQHVSESCALPYGTQSMNEPKLPTNVLLAKQSQFVLDSSTPHCLCRSYVWTGHWGHWANMYILVSYVW